MLSADSDSDSHPHGSSTNGYRPESSALEEYGAAAVTLELISSTALFLSREPFRVALARSRAPNSDDTKPEGERRGNAATQTQQQQQQDGLVEREKARRGRQAYLQRFVNTAWLSAPVGLAFAGLVRVAYPWVIRNDAFEGVEKNRQVLG